MPDDNGGPFSLDAPDLNALLGSRICHDLISPLGAIGNGVELLGMSAMADAPEMALVTESIENANARIRYYRIAFGAVGRDAQVGRAEIRAILADLYKGARVDVDWVAPGDALRADVKTAFLLLMCLEGALPWGGRITVHLTGDRWHLTGRADRLRDIADLWAIATGAPPPVDLPASDVHFALVAKAAMAAGRAVTLVSRDETRIELSF